MSIDSPESRAVFDIQGPSRFKDDLIQERIPFTTPRIQVGDEWVLGYADTYPEELNLNQTPEEFLDDIIQIESRERTVIDLYGQWFVIGPLGSVLRVATAVNFRECQNPNERVLGNYYIRKDVFINATITSIDDWCRKALGINANLKNVGWFQSLLEKIDAASSSATD